MLKVSSFAIIDIGSNSLRLVIFERLSRHPVKLLDDSTMCRLGDFEGESTIKPDHMKQAFEVIQRFMKICEALCVTCIYSFATAAIRLADNREFFLSECFSRFKIKIQVLSGEEEAFFSAKGVLSAFEDASGIVCDLGGSSMEVVRINQGKIDERVSLAIGPLALRKMPQDHQLRFLEKSFNAAEPVLSSRGTSTLYLVGGAVRAIAKIYMERNNYPIEIIHGLEMTTGQALEIFSWVKEQTPEDGSSFAAFSARVQKRQELLPMAALATHTLLERSKPQRVLISGYGLREGFVFSLLSQSMRKEDILIESCKTMVKHEQDFLHHGVKLARWVGSIIFYETLFDRGRYERLVQAVAILSHVGWVAFREYRAEYALKKVIHSPWLMSTHKDRVMIALALFYRYDGKKKSALIKPYLSLITQEDHLFCLSVGVVMRFYSSLLSNIPATSDLFRCLVQNGVLHVYGPMRLVNFSLMKGQEKTFAKVLNLVIKFHDRALGDEGL